MTGEAKQKAIDAVERLNALKQFIGYDKDSEIVQATQKSLDMAIKALEQEPCEDMGEVSDGYHTFNQLYHQRAVLFATIVNQNKDKSWKSFKHSDGNYCFDRNGEWFIVGIDTPQGSYTYHYAKEYWDMFDCEELECGKEWDGHTEEDVTRLLSLEQEACEDCISRQAVLEIAKSSKSNWIDNSVLFKRVNELPPTTSQPKTGLKKEIEELYEYLHKANETNTRLFMLLEKQKTEVLDKIRAEITNIPITDTDGHNNNWYREPQTIINDVLQIIDKYRGKVKGE